MAIMDRPRKDNRANGRNGIAWGGKDGGKVRCNSGVHRRKKCGLNQNWDETADDEYQAVSYVV
jgi:hypothetical protein